MIPGCTRHSIYLSCRLSWFYKVLFFNVLLHCWMLYKLVLSKCWPDRLKIIFGTITIYEKDVAGEDCLFHLEGIVSNPLLDVTRCHREQETKGLDIHSQENWSQERILPLSHPHGLGPWLLCGGFIEALFLCSTVMCHVTGTPLRALNQRNLTTIL